MSVLRRSVHQAHNEHTKERYRVFGVRITGRYGLVSVDWDTGPEEVPSG